MDLQWITPDHYDEAKDLAGKVVNVVPGSTIESLSFNMERPQFKDAAVREALYMQYRTVPRFYDLAPGVVALTGLSGRDVPTGFMLGSILSEWALGKPENELALKLEPLKATPFYMGFAPTMMLRYYRLRDNISTKLAGAELPPHA